MEKTLLSKVVCLKYFSRFAELTGKTTEERSTQANTVEQLWYELEQEYGFDQPIGTVRPAINHQFCDWPKEISDRDIVSFIPPVSGG
ncbi:MAG: MoaD/ThiS family protein [Porticoccaceae bacterium]|jgi:molybdopterin synthase sulfur carrier subunit